MAKEENSNFLPLPCVWPIFACSSCKPLSYLRLLCSTHVLLYMVCCGALGCPMPVLYCNVDDIV